MNKYLALLLKVAVTVGCFLILFRKTNWVDVLAEIQLISPATVLFCLVIFLTHLLAVAVRWQYFVVADGVSLDLWIAVKLVAIGSFFNQVFFGTIAGDASRIVYLVGRKTSMTTAFGSVLLDRYAALLTMWIAVVALAPFMSVHFAANSAILTGVVVIGVGGVLLLGLPIAPLFGFVADLDVLRFLQRPVRFVMAMAKMFNGSFMSKSAAARVFGPSTYLIASSSAVTWSVGVDLGADLSIWVALFVTPTALLVSAIPITIGGWGLREMSFVTLLGALGVATDTALAISLTFGILVLISAMIGGIFWLIGGRQQPGA